MICMDEIKFKLGNAIEERDGLIFPHYFIEDMYTKEKYLIKNDKKLINPIVDMLNKYESKIFCLSDVNENLSATIEKLEKEKDYWKNLALLKWGENEIFYNELCFAEEKGYELSDAYKNYSKSRRDGI